MFTFCGAHQILLKNDAHATPRKFPIAAREYFLGSLFMRSLFRVFPNFHECFYNVWNMERNVFYFFHKITSIKLKRGNSLYQSVNSPYCSWWRMRWRETFHVFHTVTEIKLFQIEVALVFLEIPDVFGHIAISDIYIERERESWNVSTSKENWQDGDKQTIRCRSYSNDIRIFTKIIKNIYITETKYSMKLLYFKNYWIYKGPKSQLL